MSDPIVPPVVPPAAVVAPAVTAPPAAVGAPPVSFTGTQSGPDWQGFNSAPAAVIAPAPVVQDLPTSYFFPITAGAVDLGASARLAMAGNANAPEAKFSGVDILRFGVTPSPSAREIKLDLAVSPEGISAGAPAVKDAPTAILRIPAGASTGDLSTVNGGGGLFAPLLQAQRQQPIKIDATLLQSASGVATQSILQTGTRYEAAGGLYGVQNDKLKGVVPVGYYVEMAATDGSGTMLTPVAAGTPGAFHSDGAGTLLAREPQAAPAFGAGAADTWGKDDWLKIAPMVVQLLALGGAYYMQQQQLDQQKELSREATENQLKMLGMQLAARGSGGGGDGGGGSGLSVKRIL